MHIKLGIQSPTRELIAVDEVAVDLFLTRTMLIDRVSNYYG